MEGDLGRVVVVRSGRLGVDEGITLDVGDASFAARDRGG
jgi:hypothetical protein